MDDLLNLTRETCSERRRELMGRVADGFADGADKYSDREILLFSEVITDLLDNLDFDTRQTLSEKIAHVQETPHDLALTLARDEIGVAQPMLENSPVLTSNDLISIANEKGIDHRLSISRRVDLDESVTDVLIDYDETEVLQSVSANTNARISPNGFIQLTDKAVFDTTILKNLSIRSDITKEAAEKVLPLLDTESQSKFINLLKQDDVQVHNLVAEAKVKTSEKKLAGAKSRIETKVLISAIQAGETTLDQALVLLTKQNRAMDCVSVLSAISGMPDPQVANALLKINGENISLLCKALEVSKPTFQMISEMRCIRLKLPAMREDNLITKYDKIDPQVAQRTLRFVKVRNKAASA